MTYKSRILCGAVKAYYEECEARPVCKQGVNQLLTGLNKYPLHGFPIDILMPEVLQIILLARLYIISLDKANKSLNNLISSTPRL